MLLHQSKKATGNRFESLNFEPYEFQEYPKVVGGDMKNPITVNSKEEEEAFKLNSQEVTPKTKELTNAWDGDQQVTEDSAAVVIKPPTKRDRLLAKAKDEKIKIDESWSTPRLEREIAKHG